MSKQLIASGFDYSKVDDDTRRKLLSLAGQINRGARKSQAGVKEIGEAAFLAHQLLAGDGRDGKFNAWIDSETGFSRSAIYEFKNYYERSQKCPVLDTFSQTVACLLSAPSVPDEAIKDFEKQVEKGVKPTVAAVKATLDRFREVAAKSAAKKSGSASAVASISTPSADSQETGAADSEPETPPWHNDHVEQEMANERATGDINTPPEPDWTGLLRCIAECRRAADTTNVRMGRKGKFCEEFQETCGILDDIVREWRKVK